ncbi:MAG: bifunctional glutamate N-acetyltransferase/amino-acid acetyltransferase ArgJ [Planctomycetaceae bacterium]
MSVGVTYPRGFRAAGVTAGFKPSGHPDLALLVGDPGTSAAGLFTTNRVAAAPVHVSKARLAAGRGLAVLVNSGQANAATGQHGVTDAFGSSAAVADLLGLPADDVLTCSTGVIGEPLHMVELLSALPALTRALSEEGGADFARAIMTTDTVAKSAEADAATFRVGGAAKGVGMISPNLATMLAFVTTDAPVERSELRLLADAELKPRFNAFTVDGCTSTNDTVLLLASGAIGSAPLRPGDGRFEALAEAIATVADSLVSQLIHDGEGATHVLLVDVEGAASDADARRVAKAVADSPLVKTAAFGGDPNPGRVVQAVGSSGVDIDPSCIDVWIGDVPLATGGTISPAYFTSPVLHDAAQAAMQAREFVVRVRVGEGPGRTRVLGCDLSYEYVRINGEYTT